MDKNFAGLYNGIKMPVIVCAPDENLTVLFMNGYARMAFAPYMSMDELRGTRTYGRLADTIRFVSPELFHSFRTSLLNAGFVERMDTEVLTHQGITMPVSIYAASARLGETGYCVIHVPSLPMVDSSQATAGLMGRILEAVNYSADADEAIRAVLALAGDYAGVSRAYVFEDESAAATKNTYEWCAPNVPSMMREYQRLEKNDYAYNFIVNSSGVFAVGDTADLPASDRKILGKRNVKSLAILPLVHYDQRLGFIGMDDCGRNRQWSLDDIQFLRSLANVVSCLISRRNVQRTSSLSNDMIQIVTDNLDDLVYISDLENYELKFVSKSMARAVRKKPEEILGRSCWSVLHQGQTGPCSFCPIPKLLEREREGSPGNYVWELHNNVTGRWYMVKDSAIEWIDGCRAHLGTFVDITYRKQYEEQLKRFAATDAMTDVYNRKWGFGKLGDLFLVREAADTPQTLCFIDFDGLKAVNDRLGHAVGDEMILNTVRILFASIRKSDFVCRWGGDEFILFLNCDIFSAQKVLDKIQFGLDHFNASAGKEYRLSISTGLVDFQAPFETLDQLIDEADRLMYDNKMKKKGRRQRESV